MRQAVVMHVRFTEGLSDEDSVTMLNDVVIPRAKALAGFDNGTWVHDSKGHGMAVVVFDTMENAAAAQDVLKPPAGVGPELISSELFVVGGQA